MSQMSSIAAPRGTLPVRYRLPAVALFILVLGWVGLRTWSGLTVWRARSVTSAAIEERWGIQVKQIGVTADGGLVDFRFTVIDKDKALALLADQKNLPALVVEDTGAVVDTLAQQGHIPHHGLNVGQTYFLLYSNVKGAIQRGMLVSVVFGDLRLEHIAAQ